jgi:hypothetical protein
VLLAPVVMLVALWASAAIWFDGPAPRWLAAVLAAIPLLSALGTLLWLRGTWRAFAVALVVPGLVILWWKSIQPSNDRDWLADVARLPAAAFDGEQVTIRNVRNFDYRSETDFTERWEERTYRLDQVVGIDFYLSTWGSPWIAHTIVSWEFADGRYLAISIETRKERGEVYSPVLGFFREYELYYVVADERDVIRLRSNYRGENVHLYRLTTDPATARALLVDYLAEVNRLNAEPRWYNAMTHNCTTTIHLHAQHVAPSNPWDWRLLVNGKLDELGYERGAVDTSVPFSELRRRSDITERARAADVDPEFSMRIRDGLPPRVAAAD